MEVIRFDVHNVPTNIHDVALCLGYFDGIHRGHQIIINNAIQSGFDAAILTLDIAPKQYFSHLPQRYLTPIEDKKNILEEMGAKYLLVLKFDDDTIALSKEEFIFKVIAKFKPACIFCGEDYSFGKFGTGNPNLLMKYYKTVVTPIFSIDGSKISSSSIFDLIANGNIDEANKLLGRNYSISGVVEKGLNNGAKIGFPTANINHFSGYVAPKNGVYETYVWIDGKRYLSMTNIGVHPTIEKLTSPIIEVHVINEDLELLIGKPIKLEFISYIREERKFKSIGDLTKQLSIDKNDILTRHSKNI